MPILGVIALGIAGLGVGGWAVDKVGEGINDASNGLLKLAVGGAITFVAMKKFKVI